MTGADPDRPSRVDRLATRGVTILRHAERRSPRTDRVLLGTALVLFVGGTWLAWNNLPEVETSPRWWLVIPASLMAVGAIAINGGEFQVSSRLLGAKVGFRAAFHVSVLSSAANVLPIPGAVLVKTRALRQQGRAYKHSIAITAAVGLMWVALAFVVAGGLQAVDRRIGAAVLMAACGLVGLGITYLLLATAVGRLGALSAALPIALIELASVASASIRIYLVLAAMGFDATMGQAVALTVAAIVATAVGIFPGGLGLRELLSAVMADLVGLDPAVGLMVSAVDRVMSYTVLGLLAAVILGTGASTWAEETTETLQEQDDVDGTGESERESQDTTSHPETEPGHQP